MLMEFVELLDTYRHPWLVTILTAAFGVAVALVAHAIAFAALRRVTRFSVMFTAVVRSAATPARVLLPVLAVSAVLGAAPQELPHGPAAEHALGLVFIAALTWMGMRAIAGVRHAVLELHPADVIDNLQARRIATQTRVLARTAMFIVLLVGAASILMTFPAMRQIGTSLLASAGVAGLVAGIAARPVLGSLIAGLQIALTQPIRIDDVVIIENEWGRIEEITATYVVVKIWDERRLVVPLQWVIEHPFQNWTRSGSRLLGTVTWWLDYRVPLAPIRAALERVCNEAPEWDRRVALIQVVDASERAIQVRALVSAEDAGKAWDLRCRVREAIVDLLQREFPEALPRLRAEVDREAHEAREAGTPPVRAGKGDSSAIHEPTHPEVTAQGDARAPAEAPDAFGNRQAPR